MTISRTINPNGIGEVHFWDITPDRPYVFDGRPCEAVDDELMTLATSDIFDFPGCLDVLGFELIGHDPVYPRTYWAKRGAA